MEFWVSDVAGTRPGTSVMTVTHCDGTTRREAATMTEKFHYELIENVSG